MFINISPCDETGKCMGEEYFVEDSTELLGKPYHYKVIQLLYWSFSLVLVLGFQLCSLVMQPSL